MSNLPIGALIWTILIPFLLLEALSIVLLIRLRRRQPPPDEGWKGSFYSNPDDPALLVAKRSGLGYTLNFGNPWSWVVLALLLGMAAVPFIWFVIIRHSPR